jgi:hypothetical protein
MSSPFELLLMQVLERVLERLDKMSTAASYPASSYAPAYTPQTYAGQSALPQTVVPYSSAVQAYQPAAALATPAVSPTSQTAAAQPSSSAMALADYPRPPEDNGRGMHWIPTVSSSPAVVDRYVADLKAMHMKWVTILNDGTNIGANDYLVQQLKANGMEPVMRVYTPGVQPVDSDELGAMVRHYKAQGVSYFQLFNEPNCTVENYGQAPDVNRYLDAWIPAAKAVTENGGLPGFGAMSPGGEFKDTEFLSQALDGLRARGETGLLDRAWLTIHNYQGDRNVSDTEGFARFKVYSDIVRQKLGRDLPEIGTEGGSFVANPAGEPQRIERVVDAYRYMAQREPYNFAYSYWNVANQAGGGHDPAWESQALFQTSGQSPLVDALVKLS